MTISLTLNDVSAGENHKYSRLNPNAKLTEFKLSLREFTVE